MAEEKPQWKDQIHAWMPYFGRGEFTARYARPIGQMADTLTQMAIEAVRLRFPGHAPSDALALIGGDRLIPRGPDESDQSYRPRRPTWLDVWGHAGLGLGLLYVVQSFLYSLYPTVRIVRRDGWWFTLDAGSAPASTVYDCMTLPCSDGSGNRYVPPPEADPRARFWMHQADPVNWDYDSNGAPYTPEDNDFWLLIYQAYPLGGYYDSGGLWGTGEAWGLGIDPGTTQVLCELVRRFKTAGARCRGILHTVNPADWDPYAPPGSPGFPDGWWARNQRIISGVATPTRRRDVRYIEMAPSL